MPEALAIKAGTDILFSEFLQTGLIYIQTASSMIPAKVLGPDAGDHVLDMCAAPGSKTTHIAALMGNRGSIDAWDVYPHKVKLIKDNAKRLGISIIHTEVRDSVKPLPFLYETYDKVLLDAPCSGLGVLGHKVELRWRRKESDLSVFPPLQKQLIEQAAKYTKQAAYWFIVLAHLILMRTNILLMSFFLYIRSLRRKNLTFPFWENL